jgi:ubiquinone/menaquinone biosynthesis C-methylase UbiE
MLEIGTSTGISAIELARLTGCKIESIDINERSIQEARRRAIEEGVGDSINFSVQDATNTSFTNELFDIVFCGNVTSLIPNRKKAFEEYYRVLKNGGILAAVPMYYIKTPSDQLIKKVVDAIQVNIDVCGKEYWMDFYKHENMVLKFVQDYSFDYISDKTLDTFIEFILSKEHLKVLSKDVFEALAKKYKEYIYLFRDNLSHMGYSIILLFKETKNPEPELFVGSLIR